MKKRNIYPSASMFVIFKEGNEFCYLVALIEAMINITSPKCLYL